MDGCRGINCVSTRGGPGPRSRSGVEKRDVVSAPKRPTGLAQPNSGPGAPIRRPRVTVRPEDSSVRPGGPSGPVHPGRRNGLQRQQPSMERRDASPEPGSSCAPCPPGKICPAVCRQPSVSKRDALPMPDGEGATGGVSPKKPPPSGRPTGRTRYIPGALPGSPGGTPRTKMQGCRGLYCKSTGSSTGLTGRPNRKLGTRDEKGSDQPAAPAGNDKSPVAPPASLEDIASKAPRRKRKCKGAPGSCRKTKIPRTAGASSGIKKRDGTGLQQPTAPTGNKKKSKRPFKGWAGLFSNFRPQTTCSGAPGFCPGTRMPGSGALSAEALSAPKKRDEKSS